MPFLVRFEVTKQNRLDKKVHAPLLLAFCDFSKKYYFRFYLTVLEFV